MNPNEINKINCLEKFNIYSIQTLDKACYLMINLENLLSFFFLTCINTIYMPEIVVAYLGG